LEEEEEEEERKTTTQRRKGSICSVYTIAEQAEDQASKELCNLCKMMMMITWR